jgi:flavorubredoxin
MFHPKKDDIDLETSVEIADGIYWIGFFDEQAGLHCNPYLIIDNDEAVVIDGGSRPDFATVMMKILQTGIAPNQIIALLYQHYDPDLCGSIPNFEDIIKRDDLKIISDPANLMFIRHYSVATGLLPTSKINNQFSFGSIVTFDETSGILFTSDLFGSLGLEWELFLKLRPECMECVNRKECPSKRANCPLDDILMTS